MAVESTPVLSFMTANVKTAMENQPIREVCKMMYQNKNGSMLILKKMLMMMIKAMTKNQ